MADSEKGNSSNGEAKAKKSMLDDDFSKDFLSSWKSGPDDMDFDFAPVSKGKKKAFEFGMDMDFSLDDAFGKMPSFKMDMEDLDFSSSPKKTTKSKEKSEEDSAKGNRSDKHDKFNFSFDFNGLDDFSLDVPSNRKGRSPNTEKTNCESEDSPSKVTDDKRKAIEDIISKEMSSEDASSSKSKDLVIGNGDPDTTPENSAKKSTLLTHPVRPEETLVSSDAKLSENIQKNYHQSHHVEETSLKSLSSLGKEDNLNPVHISKPAQSIGSPLVMESTELITSTDDDIQLKEYTTSNQPHSQVEVMDVSVNVPLDDASTQVRIQKEVKISSSEREVKQGSSEGRSVCGEFPAAVVGTSDAEKLTVVNSSLQSSIEKMNIRDEKNKLEDGDGLDSAKLPFGTGKPSANNDTTVLPSSARSTSEVQKPALKVSSVPLRRPNATNTGLLRNTVPGATNLKFPTPQTKNDGMLRSSALKNNETESMHLGSLDKSYGNIKLDGKIPDDNRSSRSKELIKKDTVLDQIQKNPSAHMTPSDVDADSMRHDGKSAKHGLPSLESEKMVNNVKSSGSKFRSAAHVEQEAKFSNKSQRKLENKISSIASFQKLNAGLGNRLLSQKIDKKLPALPSLKLTRNTATDKRPGTPNMQGYGKSLGDVEKSSRLQSSIKTVSPVFAEKQSPSTPSLKRKTSEAADMDPANLRLPKRASPNERRMPKASPRDLGDQVQEQESLSEGNGKNATTESLTPKFNLDQEANMEALQFSLMVDNDANVEKAEACAKELENICNMLKKKHEEAKELLVRALVNNNNLLMLNHPIYDEKIRAVQRFASRLMSKESSSMSKELDVEA